MQEYGRNSIIGITIKQKPFPSPTILSPINPDSDKMARQPFPYIHCLTHYISLVKYE
jgi:hypothetical protein